MQGTPHSGAGWRGDLFIGLGSPKVIWWKPKIASNSCSSHRSAAAGGDSTCRGLNVHKNLIFFCLAGEKRETCA